MAQLAQAPSSLYEGQKISAVSLIGNPRRNLETLYPLVREIPGGPCSQGGNHGYGCGCCTSGAPAASLFGGVVHFQSPYLKGRNVKGDHGHD